MSPLVKKPLRSGFPVLTRNQPALCVSAQHCPLTVPPRVDAGKEDALLWGRRQGLGPQPQGFPALPQTAVEMANGH